MRSVLLMFAFSLFILPSQLKAQKGGPVVFTVDNDTVWGEEFERVFNKNNRKPEVRPTEQEILEYRNLYVRFKLKVHEAYRLGMDTNQSYKQELAGYRKQLAQPYLTDKAVTDKLVKEAYDRLLYEVDASNLMIYLSPVATPEDTLAAFKQISNWQSIIASGAMSFEKLTTDSSTDEHGRKNAGRLGYFTAFNMIYPFENQAYNTPVGGVSQVFRSQYGYHVLKVNDKRPARGDVKVAHILIRINNDADYDLNKPRIDAIYERLQKGEDWNKLVLDFSEDFNTREKGGELNWVKSIGGNVPEAFREASFKLKDGKYSEPVKTELGWHIIKRIEQKPLPSFEESKEAIKLKISRDSRSELNREAVLERIKKENNFNLFEKNLVEYMTLIDTNSLKGEGWEIPTALASTTPLFSIGEKNYTYNQFSNFLKENPPTVQKIAPKVHAEQLFEQYCNNQNLIFEDAILESKYPEFKYLMQEYRDGILLFELTNEKVWSKATQDTIGLREFFNNNQNKYNWNERVAAKTYTCSNPKIAKKVRKSIAKGISDETLLATLNKKDALSLKINQKVYERGQDSAIDALNWAGGAQQFVMGNNTVVVTFGSILPPGPKQLKEAMGPATSDYQTYLEDLWIDELKQRYKVVLNPAAVSKLFVK